LLSDIFTSPDFVKAASKPPLVPKPGVELQTKLAEFTRYSYVFDLQPASISRWAIAGEV
jgi:hypothetical protein